MDTPFRIATWNAISAKGLRRFPAHAYRVEHALADPDAILLRALALEAAAVAARAQAIARSGAGVNNVPVAQMSLRGIPVFNAPGANANAVKELVMAAILLAARNLVPAIDGSRPWGPDSKRVEAARRRSRAWRCAARPWRRGAGAIGGWSRTRPKLGLRVVGYDPGHRRDHRGCPRRCGS
jgi:D-3-phosphoglycerate dehydrogenase